MVYGVIVTETDPAEIPAAVRRALTLVDPVLAPSADDQPG